MCVCVCVCVFIDHLVSFFGVFSMTSHGIEPRSLGPLLSPLTVMLMEH